MIWAKMRSFAIQSYENLLDGIKPFPHLSSRLCVTQSLLLSAAKGQRLGITWVVILLDFSFCITPLEHKLLFLKFLFFQFLSISITLSTYHSILYLPIILSSIYLSIILSITLSLSTYPSICQSRLYRRQCDQTKIAKCLWKLPKNDFTRNMIDFDTFTKIA